mgnify:CR=1 FL=1
MPSSQRFAPLEDKGNSATVVIDGEKDSYFPLEVFGLFTVRECCWGLDLPVSKRDLVVPWVRRV